MEASLEKSLVLIKPDATQRGLIGEIISRLEKRGLKLVAMKMVLVTPDLAKLHYAVHLGKPFYEGLINYIQSAPIVAMVWEGPNSISLIRQTMGATDPLKADPGTVRHDLAVSIGRNLTHASDSSETAEQEVSLWFRPDEIIGWDRALDGWVFAKN
jgi:nucleoside-diphosphate kinase